MRLKRFPAAYLKRLKTMANVEILELPEEVNRPDGLEREAAKIFEVLPKQCYVCAMCIEGKQLSSEEFAALIDSVDVVLVDALLALCAIADSIGI